MGYPSRLPTSKPTFRGTLGGDGHPGPIEERIGRRLVRLVDPESPEGIRLLGHGDVDLVGPDGEQMGRVAVRKAFRLLKTRMERRLGGPSELIGHGGHGGLDAELKRLREWARRLGA